MVTVNSVDGPQSGRKNEKDKDRFYNDLSADMQSKNGKCIVWGNFIGHVGSLINGYKRVHGEHGWGIQTKDGERLLEVAANFDMVIGNTFFTMILFQLDGNSSIIDYIAALLNFCC